ncbi:MAG: hypothetical protein ABIP81_05570 [Terriglobales bacterium]
MTKINLTRVFLGGAVAGIFAISIQYIAFFLGAYQRLSAVTGVNWHDFPVGTHITIAAMEILIGGPMAVWFYAAIRPRFGAGPRTAVIAGAYLWAVLCPYGLTVLTTLGLLAQIPLTLMIMLNAVALPFMVGAVLVGAKIYQEDTVSPPLAQATGK